MKKFLAMLSLALCGTANAGLLHFEGMITGYTDVVVTQFVVESDQVVSAWTDSFDSGANFDPITSLWTNDGTYITGNDDNSSISPSTQTYFDSGIQQFLTAGTYYFTISVFNNFPDSSVNLFANPSPFDGCDGCGYGGFYYSQWLDGVASARVITSNPVPEGSMLAIFALGLLSLARSRKSK